MNADLMMLLPKLMEFATAAAKFVENATDEDGIDADDVTQFVLSLAKDWHPKISGLRVLDDEGTRHAGARFLAGLAIAAAKKRVRRRKSSVRVEAS